MAPGGLFCMSGPVAHADDDDDDDNHFFYSQIQQATLFEAPSLKSQKASAVRQECNVKEESANHRLSDVEFLTDHYSQCCVKFHCSDGTCKMLWSSGSSYKGEVMDGNLHGIGMYTGADGTVYEGNWILNKKHGFGIKQYANGDVYEGLWKWDVPEGKGRYVWSNGSEYGGEWRNGLMCGIGVLTWVGGDSYDGQWLNGLADGHGVYTWADGSVYIGTWKKGLKFGTGRFFSPGRKSMDTVSMPDTRMNLEKIVVAGDEFNNYSREYAPDACMDFHKIPVVGESSIDCHECSKHSNESQQELVSTSEATLYDKLTADMETSTQDNHQESNPILEKLWRLDSPRRFFNLAAKTNPCEYLEERRSSDYLEERRSSAFCSENVLGVAGEGKRDSDLWSIKQGHGPGEIVSKGHRSYDLVTALQLGIRYSVLEVSRGHDRKLFPTDFGPKASVKAKLPKESSHVKAYLDSVDFKWIDYCPTVFRRLREMSKVVAASYIQSICGAGGLRELPSPGKSGCLFYLSQDKGFMIKTLRKTEVKTFLRMLPRYYNHIRTYNNTLLTKFFGLHGVKLAGGRKVRFVVMGNVFASEARIDRMYDLKGSSEGRIATNMDETTGFAPLKDLDLDVVLELDPCSRQTVLEQIERDCKFLESERIMDYSLLLGLQYKNGRQNSSSFQERCSKGDIPLHDKMESNFGVQNGVIAEPSAKVGHTSEQLNNTPRISFERSCLEDETQVDYFVPSRQNTQHSVQIQAKTCERPLQGSYDASKSQDVVLHFGIIDILQEYDFSKRLEHAYKSLYFDPLSISAVDPTSYSKRFQKLMHQVFIETT